MMNTIKKNMSKLTTTFACAIMAFVTISLLAGCGEKVTSINIDVGDYECNVDCPDVDHDGVCDDSGDPCQNPGNGGDGDGDVDGDGDSDGDVENCGNGRDDDGDGYVDCDDQDCSGSSSCQDGPGVESDCNDRCDNDGDGYTDCDDSDCASDPVCDPAPDGPVYCWDRDLDDNVATIDGTCHHFEDSGGEGDCYSPVIWTDPAMRPRCMGPGDCSSRTVSPRCCIGYLATDGHIDCTGPEYTP